MFFYFALMPLGTPEIANLETVCWSGQSWARLKPAEKPYPLAVDAGEQHLKKCLYQIVLVCWHFRTHKRVQQVQ